MADGKGYAQKGKFFVADRQVDQKTGAIRLAGIFANPGNALRPGQYARIRAVLNTQKDALLIPLRAVTELQGTHRVAVVGADNKVSIRSVALDHSPILVDRSDGLKADETVVFMARKNSLLTSRKSKAAHRYRTVNPEPQDLMIQDFINRPVVAMAIAIITVMPGFAFHAAPG